MALAGCIDPALGPTYTLVFSDEFNYTGAPDPAKWRVYNGDGHNGNGLRHPSAFAGNGSNMVITASMFGAQLLSGGMAARHEMAYGRYEVRVRVEADPAHRMSGVVLTWPQSNQWPMDGENDFFETGVANGDDRSPFYAFIHYGTSPTTQVALSYPAAASALDWHTVTMDWTPTAITTYLDGAQADQTTNLTAIPDVAHHLCLQLDAMSGGAGATIPQSVRMFVDYVRVYSIS